MPKVTIARAFTLQRDNGKTQHFSAGRHEMSLEDANHWFVRAHTDVQADAAIEKAEADHAVVMAERQREEQARLAAEEADRHAKEQDEARIAADKAAAEKAAAEKAAADKAAAKKAAGGE